MLNVLVKAYFGVQLVLALAGCGGGGSDSPAAGTGASSSPTATQVSFSPASADIKFPADGQSTNPTSLVVSATIKNPPSGQVFAILQADAAVVQPGPTAVVLHADGTYSATILFNRSLAAGSYSGHFTLKLCQDSACNVPYAISGEILPYTVTVTPPIKLTALVNNVATPLNALQLRDGAVLTLQSSLPVFWTTSSGGVRVDNLSSTTTSWTGTLRYSVSTAGSVGILSIDATTPPPLPQARAEATLSVRQ